MKTKKSVFFVGGCAGTGSPASARIICPSETSAMPLVRPVARKEFGTHTTSFGIVSQDIGIFIDNGSGINHVSDFLLAEGVTRIVGLQTHFHLDHCSGLPTNQLLFRKVHGEPLVAAIYSPIIGPVGFEQEMEKYFQSHVWPVSPAMFGIKHKHIASPPDSFFTVHGLRVTSTSQRHPGGSVGYKIALPEGDVVIATDNELAEESDKKFFAEFVTGSALLYIDIQYRDSEYEGNASVGGGDTVFIRRNWGHSTPSMLVDVVRRIEPKLRPQRILVGHHDPRRPDGDLLAFEFEMREVFEGLGVTLSFARECQAIELAHTL